MTGAPIFQNARFMAPPPPPKTTILPPVPNRSSRKKQPPPKLSSVTLKVLKKLCDQQLQGVTIGDLFDVASHETCRSFMSIAGKSPENWPLVVLTTSADWVLPDDVEPIATGDTVTVSSVDIPVPVGDVEIPVGAQKAETLFCKVE